MRSLKGKKILILGGTAPCVHVTQYAKEMGAFVYVADDKIEKGPAKQIADEAIVISTKDYDTLLAFVKEKNIAGIMTGPGEFNIVNAMIVSKLAGLPFYCEKDQWDLCQNKRNFKDFCKRNSLPVVPEYTVDDVLTHNDFPVIVKPVDGCSSRGITVCHNQEEYEKARMTAVGASRSQQIIVEKFIDNGGITIDAKYVAIDGKCYLEAIGDRYVMKDSLITAVSIYPSKYLNTFLEQVDPFVEKAFSSIGLRNGAFFFQAIPDGDKIYIYEMGLRVSGGMIYKMTEATSGNNSLKMLVQYSATGQMCEEADAEKIDAGFKGQAASTLAIPLKAGKIASFGGFDAVCQYPGVIDFTRYYGNGDEILPRHLNTLDQLFGRIMVTADSEESLWRILNNIRETVTVRDDKGEEMIQWSTFDYLYSRFLSKNKE